MKTANIKNICDRFGADIIVMSDIEQGIHIALDKLEECRITGDQAAFYEGVNQLTLTLQFLVQEIDRRVLLELADEQQQRGLN